jgi:hypothetical protein
MRFHTGQEFERALFLPCVQKLEKLGMRPHQRHGAAGRLAGLESATADIKALALKAAPEAVKTLEHIMIGSIAMTGTTVP